MAIGNGNGNARLIKEEKKSPAMTLKESEIRMLFALAIVGISVLVIYFLLLPMYTNITVLEDDVRALQYQEDEYRLQIARTEEFKDTYKKALNEYNELTKFFYEPMVPEMIDERITSMMISHGLTPSALTMTALTVEGIPKYAAEELWVNPVPIIEEETAVTENQEEGVPGEGTTEPETDPGAAGTQTGDGGAIYDSYVFVYTVQVSAYGGRDKLYTFLAQVAPMTAMHVTKFSFTDPVTEKATVAGEKDRVIPGTVDMEVKLYVYVEGVPARERAEN